MSNHTYSSLYFHVIWSTKNREPYIRPEFKSKLYDFMGKYISNKKWIPLAINGTEDHVHILIQLFPSYKISEVISCIKSNSSRFIKENFDKNFAWQGGYSIFTIDIKLLPKIKNYIARQEEHHKSKSFEDEFKLLLIRNKIEHGNYSKLKNIKSI